MLVGVVLGRYSSEVQARDDPYNFVFIHDHGVVSLGGDRLGSNVVNGAVGMHDDETSAHDQVHLV